jgi:hypothetical protein
MITLSELAAEALGSFLASAMKDRFGASHARLAEVVPFAAQRHYQGDEDGTYIVDESGRKISLPRGASDAALAPYHVEAGAGRQL